MIPTNRGKPIYEGKAKILYPGPDSDTLIQHFKDDITAFNQKKKQVLAGKGILNCLISEIFYHRLGLIGIPNHFIRRLNMRDQLVRRLDMFPVEVVVRNVASGSLVKRIAIEEGTRLQRSIIEFYHKDDDNDDPMVSEEHITAFGWMSPQDIDDVVAITLRINDFLQGLLYGAGLILVDMKLEFGRHFDEYGDIRVLLADEISPDTMRLWDVGTQKRLDKDRFRNGMPDVIQAYREVASRLGIPFEQTTVDGSKSLHAIHRPDQGDKPPVNPDK